MNTVPGRCPIVENNKILCSTCAKLICIYMHICRMGHHYRLGNWCGRDQPAAARAARIARRSRLRWMAFSCLWSFRCLVVSLIFKVRLSSTQKGPITVPSAANTASLRNLSCRRLASSWRSLLGLFWRSMWFDAKAGNSNLKPNVSVSRFSWYLEQLVTTGAHDRM